MEVQCLGFFSQTMCCFNTISEDRGLLRAGQDFDEVGHPAYLLPTPRQYLSSATHYLT